MSSSFAPAISMCCSSRPGHRTSRYLVPALNGGRLGETPRAREGSTFRAVSNPVAIRPGAGSG